MCICALFSFFACAFLLFYALFCMHQRVIKFRAPQPAKEHPGILRPPTGVSFNRQLLAIKATKNNTRKIYYPPAPIKFGTLFRLEYAIALFARSYKFAALRGFLHPHPECKTRTFSSARL